MRHRIDAIETLTILLTLRKNDPIIVGNTISIKLLEFVRFHFSHANTSHLPNEHVIVSELAILFIDIQEYIVILRRFVFILGIQVST